MLWQKAFIEAFYSFKMTETGFDRFKKLLLLIARKNTKSETSSALANSEFIVEMRVLIFVAVQMMMHSVALSMMPLT